MAVIPHVMPNQVVRAAEQNLLIDQVNQNTQAIQGIEVGEGVLPYTHTQTTPAATWSGSHNLNRIPRVVVLDDSSHVVLADVSFPTLNTFVVTHASPTAGSVHFL